MTEEEVIEITNRVFEESFEIDREKLVPEAHIFQDLELDSLDVVDMVVELQKNFGVRIQNEERLREIRTLQDVYQYILSKKAEAAG
jgi:acyl carrier protein